MVLTDLDGDGVNDLVIANTVPSQVGPYEITVRLGVGNGTFPTAVVVPIDGKTGATPDLIAHDLDGDGRPELLVVGPDFLQVFENHAGVLVAGAKLAAGGDGIGHVAAADLDGDGRAEIVATRVVGGVSVLTVFSNLGATFGPGQDALTESSVLQPFVATGDVDGDGAPDVVVADVYSPGVTLLRNGTGVLAPPLEMATSAAPVHVFVKDVDADGDNDIVTYSVKGVVETLLGDGRGGFSLVTSGSVSTSAIFQGQTAYFLAGGVLADISGDGLPDLIVPTTLKFDGIALLLGNGDGTFAESAAYSPFARLFAGDVRLAVGDVDGDGRVEVAIPVDSRVSFGEDGAVAILQNRGGALLPAVVYRPGDSLGMPASADLDHDGTTDIVSSAGFVGVFRGSKGSFVDVDVPYAAASAVALGDVTGDGFTDIVALAKDEVQVLANTGDGHFSPPISHAAPGATDVAVGDLDGDGRADVLLGTENGLGVMLSEGGGTLGPPAMFDVGNPNWNAVRFPVIGDFTGDHVPDVIAYAFGTGSTAIYPGLGNGAFGTKMTLFMGADGVTPVDLDRDGELELAVLGGGGLEVMRRENGVYGVTKTLLTQEYEWLVVGDFDADGFPDLVGGGKHGTEIGFFRNDGTGALAFGGSFASEHQLGAVAGDFDGDGASDIVTSANAGGFALFRAACRP